MTVVPSELWFRSFEPDIDEGPRRAVLLRRLSDGKRDDLYLARLDPGIPELSPQTVILASRHQGHTIDSPAEWPIHVYVCPAPPLEDDEGTISDESLRIDSWGLLYLDLAAAAARDLNPRRVS